MKNLGFCVSVGVLAFSLAIFGGCGSTDPSRFYTLSALGPEEAGGQAILGDSEVIIGVGPVTLPEYLARSQIITRESPNQLGLAEFERWAEPLEESLPRTLAENLSVLLGTDKIIVFPWKKSITIDCQIAVDVIRFDGTLGGDTSLYVRWTLFGKGGDELLAQKKSTIIESMDGEDYEALVAAESRALEKLSREIATEIAALSR
jgi:uncharacterized lipoprotein YmbA